MVETERDFSKKKMKKFSRHSTVRIKPMFCITPKALDAVDVSSAFGSSGLLPDHNMISTDGKGPVGMPVIGIIQAAGSGVLSDQPDHLTALAPLNRKDPDSAVSLQDAENDDLACGSPATFARSTPAKRGLVAFYGTLKWLPALFLKSKHGPYEAKKSFNRRSGNLDTETHPVDRYAQNEKLKESFLSGFRKSTGIPNRSPGVSVSATTAFESAVGQSPSPGIRTFRTPSHDQNILHDLVRFG